MINILHLTHTDIKSDSRILKEMQSLATVANYKVSGIGIHKIEELDRKSNLVDNIEIYSLDIKSRKWKFLPSFVRHTLTLVEFYFKLFVLSLKLKPKIIHSNDVLVLPIGVLVKIFTKSKLIYDAHELESEKNGISRFKSKIIFFTEKVLWKFIDHLIVVSPSIENWYKEKIDKKKSEVIMNSPVLLKDKNSNKDDYLRKKFGIPTDKRIFIYVGGLVQGRGIETLLNVFKNEKIESHIVFLGYGKLDSKILSLSQKHLNIHIHNAVSHEKVVPISKSADVGVCFIQNISLSDYYCLPNKLFEYAFSRIPVLASNFPDIKKVVQKYKLGKCSELSENEIFNIVKEFEEMEYIEKIDESKLYDLSWQAQEEKLFKIYKVLGV